MHDPMKWALPLYRAFGIQVRVHILFLVTIALCFRQISELKGTIWWFDVFMITTGLVFLSVLLHEYGHSFSARWVGGDSNEILLWPLGGLAYVEVPHTPRHNAIVTICGPLVNVAIVGVCSLALLAGGFSPAKALNPFKTPYTADTYNLNDGRTYSTGYRHFLYKPGTAEQVGIGIQLDEQKFDLVAGGPTEQAERALLPAWSVWAWRLCWINWWLFLFNMLIPAYPMDCGRLLHAYLWSRTDYRQATITCCYVGYGVAVILLIVTIVTNEFILGGLALFIGMTCYMTLRTEMETERGAFGYDFSQGYTSLERDDPPPPRPRRKNFVRRWLDARKAKKMHREQEQKLQDDQRMDQLLEKIARAGKNSLTDEERRFMERVSARYRNK
jgi:Zn-dependent protease